MGNLYWSKGGNLQQLCSSSSGMQEGGYGLSPTDYIIAAGGLNPLIFDEAVNRTAQKHLYEKLTENDSLIQDSVMQNFVIESEPVAIGRLTEISVKQSELWKTTGNDSSLISGFRNIFFVYKDSLQIIDSLLRISVGSLNINPLLNEKESLLSRFTNLYAELLTDVQAWTQAKEVNRLSALSENNGYNFTEIYEQNQQQVNRIYLETVVQGIYIFNSNQLSILQSISEQCPVSGGRAVYGARALLSITDPLATYNDKVICNQQGIPYRIKNDTIISKETIIKVYPNPTEGLLTLVSDKTENGAFDVEVINITGSKVKVGKIVLEEGSSNIDISDIPDGIYILRIIESAIVIRFVKITK